MNIGTLTPFFTFNVLLGRGSVIVGDRLILRFGLLFAFTVFIGLGKGTVDAFGKSFVRGTFFCGIIFCEFFAQFFAGAIESIIDSVTRISNGGVSVCVTSDLNAGSVGGQEGQ